MEKGYIKTLYSDFEKTECVFPRTKVKAISDDDGIGLDALINTVPHFKETEEHEVSTVPLDADTLGGKPASEYATQSFVTTKIAEAQFSGGGDADSVDLSGFATKDDLDNLITVADIDAICNTTIEVADINEVTF